MALVLPKHIRKPQLSAKVSVYGKRDGCISGLAVLPRDFERQSIFRNTKGWKQGVVHGVEMLPRASMHKPEVPCAALGLGEGGGGFADNGTHAQYSRLLLASPPCPTSAEPSQTSRR